MHFRDELADVNRASCKNAVKRKLHAKEFSGMLWISSWYQRRFLPDAEWRDFKLIQKQAERASEVFTREMYRQVLSKENVPVLKALGMCWLAIV